MGIDVGISEKDKKRHLSEQFALLSYHIAKIDNRVTLDELEYTVLNTAEAISDFEASERIMAKHIRIDEYDIDDVILSVSEDYRKSMFRALVMVATANHHLTKEKRKYLDVLAKSWGIDEKECNEVIQSWSNYVKKHNPGREFIVDKE